MARAARAALAAVKGFCMKRICLFLSFGVIGAMEQSDKFPKDIYDAINHRDQRAVEYYAKAGQVNLNDGDASEEYVLGEQYGELYYGEKQADRTWKCFPRWPNCNSCCFCCDCGRGVERYTPLYWAINKKNISAARALIGAGARLNTGKCVGLVDGDYPKDDLEIGTSAAALVALARKNKSARALLFQVIEQELPLLSGKKRGDDEFLRGLLACNDPLLFENITKNGVVSPALLACAAVENRHNLDSISCVFSQEKSGVKEVYERILKAIERSGDQRLIGMVLSEKADAMPDVLKSAIVGGHKEMVAFVLAKNPDRDAVKKLMPLARSRAIALTLEAYSEGEPLPLPRPAWQAPTSANSALGCQLADMNSGDDKKQL